MNLVLSDFHIGHPQSLISSPSGEPLLHQFINEVKELGDVDHLILLGDIFDFWDESLTSSITHSHKFFEKMSEITEEITYVPGNHDHHMLILCETMEDIVTMGRGSIPDRPFRDILKYEFPHTSPEYVETPFFQVFLPPSIPFHVRLYYPEFNMTWKGKTIVFRHGHYLDSGLFQFMPWVYEHLGGKIKNERDFEIINTPIYEHLYYTGPVKEVNEFYKRINGWVGSLSKKIYKNRVHKTIENRKKDIECFFDRFKKKYPDILIFGHTHVADKGTLHDMELYNAGCWIHEASIPHSHTYIVIEDTIEIRKVGEGVLFSSQ